MADSPCEFFSPAGGISSSKRDSRRKKRLSRMPEDSDDVQRRTRSRPVAEEDERELTDDLLPQKRRRLQHSEKKKKDRIEPHETCGTPYVELMKQVTEFQTKTPKRFRRTTAKSPAAWKNPHHPKLTSPKEFHFVSEERSRPVFYEGHEDIQKKRFDNTPKFKARQLDTRIFESRGELGVPRKRRAPPTSPKPFHFLTEERSAAIREREAKFLAAESEEPLQLKALPIPETLYEPEKGHKSHRKQIPLTIPKSPALVTKIRFSEKRKRRELHKEDDEASKSFVALPMPTFSPPPLPKRADPSLTVPKPFDLLTQKRGRRHEEEFHAKVAEEEEDSKCQRSFRAMPMPIFEGESSLSAAEKGNSLRKETVVPQPFHLETDDRHEKHRLASEKKRKQGEELENEMRHFKAANVPDFSRLVGIPEKHDLPLTKTKAFQFNTETRAEGRKVFEEVIREKESLLEEGKVQIHEERKKLDAEAIRRFRKQATFHARPVHRGHPIVIQPSSAKLTVPMSPAFPTKQRFGLLRV